MCPGVMTCWFILKSSHDIWPRVTPQYFISSGQVCNCEGICSCIQAPASTTSKSLIVGAHKWDILRDAFINGSTDDISSAVLDIESKPQVRCTHYRCDKINLISCYTHGSNNIENSACLQAAFLLQLSMRYIQNRMVIQAK